MDPRVEEFKARVARAVDRPRDNRPRAGLTPASVLVPIMFKAGEPHLIVTLRTMNVATHKGQISFPGGVREPGDRDEIETALRESREEIGLSPDAVTVVGLLDNFATTSGFCVTPVVGFLEAGASYSPDPVEVAEIIEAPFAVLADPTRHEFGTLERDGLSYSSHFYSVGEHTIWGATAGIIHRFLAAIDAAA